MRKGRVTMKKKDREEAKEEQKVVEYFFVCAPSIVLFPLFGLELVVELFYCQATTTNGRTKCHHQRGLSTRDG